MCAHRDTCGRESRNPVVSFTWFRIPEKVGQESSRGKNTEKWQELFMHVIPIAGGWLYCMLSPKIALFFRRYMFFVICHLYRHFGLHICPHSYEIITRCLLAECGEVLHKYLVNSWLRACNFLLALWEKQGKYFTHEENWAKTLSLTDWFWSHSYLLTEQDRLRPLLHTRVVYLGSWHPRTFEELLGATALSRLWTRMWCRTLPQSPVVPSRVLARPSACVCSILCLKMCTVWI